VPVDVSGGGTDPVPERSAALVGAPQPDLVRPELPQISPLIYLDAAEPEVETSLLSLGELEASEGTEFATTGSAVQPQILNADEIQKQMERRYPPLLLDAGIGGTVVLDFFVDESGTPTVWQIVQSSGHPLLDQAALRMASTFRFSPARTRSDQVVPVWTRFPIRFQVL
jgi:TonB family protein